jgi:hypothetical protein
MTVADLQRHLGDMATFLDGAKATKAIIDDLKAISSGLTPFAALALKDFAAFLARAEEFDRTGQVSKDAKGTKAPRATSAPKATPNVDALAGEALALYQRAADPSVTQADIDQLMTKLGPLTKPGLVTIADRLGLKGMNAKAKAKILGELRSSIEDRKGSFQRSGMLHPQGEPAPS